MDQNKLYSLAFALVVFFSVLIGNSRQASDDVIVYDSYLPEKTSVTANAKDAVMPAVETGVSAPPAIGAASAIVKYAGEAAPLFSLHPQRQWPIASLTKLMTAAVAMEKIDPAAEITASASAVETEGAAGNLAPGTRYRRDDLLRWLLKISSNDAGEAIAEHLGRENFIRAMNDKAISLGMYSTRFFDPTGLSALNQSTAGDLEKMALYIFNFYPDIFLITRDPEANIHPFAKEENFIGGKTGFIDEASGNLISLFNHRGRPLLIVVLGSEDRAEDTRKLYKAYVQ